MMKAILLSLFVALLMVGCGEWSNPSESVDMTDTAPKKDAIETAVDWSKLQDRNGVTYLPNTQEPFSGCAKRAYGNEQIEVLAQFKDGYVVRRKEWWENGTPRREENFKDGKKHGLWTRWYRNGQKKGEINHKDGKPDGSGFTWYENGQKHLESNYKDGRLDGLQTMWYDGGQKKVEANYKDGKMEGFAKRWRKTGLISEEGYWKAGKIMSVVMWKPNGEKCSHTNLKNGNGLVTGYYDNGQRTGVGNHVGGRFMSAIVFKPNGEKCPVTNLRNGNGVVVWYDEEGSEKTRRNFKNGEQFLD
tara:strand:+ start:32 stop:937 length:906 start_codon:yes stop_codon:yes gene_type:complete